MRCPRWLLTSVWFGSTMVIRHSLLLLQLLNNQRPKDCQPFCILKVYAESCGELVAISARPPHCHSSGPAPPPPLPPQLHVHHLARKGRQITEELIMVTFYDVLYFHSIWNSCSRIIQSSQKLIMNSCLRKVDQLNLTDGHY